MESPTDPPSPETIAARGGWTNEFVTRPSAPPVYMTTAFDLADLQQLDAVVGGQERGYVYTRDGNPNQEAFAADVAALEGAANGVACSSGMGALTAVLLALTKSGDHIVAARGLYGRTYQLLQLFANNYGVTVSFVDAADMNAVRAAVTPQTRLGLIESLSNPLVEVTDIGGWAEALGAIPLLVDNTFATPCLCRPMEHGAKLVWHSGSKYLNGHGDVMLGVVVGEGSLLRKIRGLAALSGVNSNPMEAWLASRGLRTLPLRMARVSQTASELAQWLTEQPPVSRVFYPGLTSHRSHALAAQLLRGGFGGMLAFELRGGRTAVDRCFARLQHRIPFSPTLADARTTVSYPWGTSHKFLPVEERLALGIGEGLVRLSVGLEAFGDLQRELALAIAE